MYLRFKRAPPGEDYQPSCMTLLLLKVVQVCSIRLSECLVCNLIMLGFSADIIRSILSVPKILPDVLPSFIPYAAVMALFAAFVKWNGGIVLGTGNGYFFYGSYLQHLAD
jgi:hypothetical protein